VVSPTSKKLVSIKRIERIERIDMKTTKDKPRSGYTCKFCGKPAEKKNAYCGPDCEIAFLRAELAKKSERKSGDPCCYGRVEWGTCVQELYATSSFDAKKRTSELRKLGFICEATRIKAVPIIPDGDDTIVNEQMTILTCNVKRKNGAFEMPPRPEFWSPGLLSGTVAIDNIKRKE